MAYLGCCTIYVFKTMCCKESQSGTLHTSYMGTMGMVSGNVQYVIVTKHFLIYCHNYIMIMTVLS